MRFLAIDPGEKRLGIALSDDSGTIANPLTILEHVSRPLDAAAIAQLISGFVYNLPVEVRPKARI